MKIAQFCSLLRNTGPKVQTFKNWDCVALPLQKVHSLAKFQIPGIIFQKLNFFVISQKTHLKFTFSTQSLKIKYFDKGKRFFNSVKIA